MKLLLVKEVKYLLKVLANLDSGFRHEPEVLCHIFALCDRKKAYVCEENPVQCTSHITYEQLAHSAKWATKSSTSSPSWHAI